MKIKIFEFNPIAVNTYVLYDKTGECVIVDPACFYPNEQEALVKFIKDKRPIKINLIEFLKLLKVTKGFLLIREAR